MCYCKLVKCDWLPLFYGRGFQPFKICAPPSLSNFTRAVIPCSTEFSVQNDGGNSHVMGATVAMERSIEFRLLGFYTLWLCSVCSKALCFLSSLELNQNYIIVLQRHAGQTAVVLVVLNIAFNPG